jgi:hypothetical protein
MFSQSKQHHLLYVITAILLLMQSFAIWHDAEHAFHTKDQKCERFEAFSHHPALDVIPHNPVIATIHTVIVVPIQSVTLPYYRQPGAYAIRAPPSFS